jgi:hypothetical protein
MREVVVQMFAKYDCQRVEDITRALREILQRGKRSKRRCSRPF